ncbi:uncharacterized protein LOC133194685 [Saccostrea echinata]|uniref:uncharacterized protein LOC133194685 n=1 Tax=Saccostrea echinata TaxID=191078 RepID=UPI002A81D9C8|nr:uncharacterized protein LOC133194685 [Saccostrea echinata]
MKDCLVAVGVAFVAGFFYLQEKRINDLYLEFRHEVNSIKLAHKDEILALHLKMFDYSEKGKAHHMFLNMEKNLEKRMKAAEETLTNSTREVLDQIAFDTDAIAQASCAGTAPEGHFVAAIRRDCGENKLSCDTICNSGTTSMRNIYGNQGSVKAACFGSYHIYQKRIALKPEDKGRAGMAMHKYKNGCSQTGCGPNYCCCRA